MRSYLTFNDLILFCFSSHFRQAKKSSNGLSKYNWDTDTFEQDNKGFSQPDKKGFSQPDKMYPDKNQKPEPKRETALSSK